MKYKQNQRGFTLLEVLIVIGIIAVLSAAVLVAVNPTRQFKLARDSQRVANVSAIANAISQNMSEHKGTFTCESEVTTTDELIANDKANIASCLVPDYISSLPFNPGTGHYTDESNYNLDYKIKRNSAGRIVISSTGEIEPVIEAVR